MWTRPTGKVVFARAADRRRSIASTTKLMTALLTLEREKLATVMRASRYRAAPIESKIDLVPGERLTVADLMRALLLESANDAAVTLAEGVSGSRETFVRAMNRRARRLGLDRTRYANPIGLDEEGNYSVGTRPRHAGRAPRALRLLPPDRQPHVGDAEVGRPRADGRRTATAWSAARSGSTGSRPATPSRPATCSWAPRTAPAPSAGSG